MKDVELRIALTITELHPGGAEKCFVHLALDLKQQGHEVAVWQLWPAPPPDKKQLVTLLDKAGIPWHSGKAQSALGFALCVNWLRKELKAFQPDVVQSFLFHANLATSFAARGLSPVIGGVRVRQPERWRWRLQKWASRNMERLVCVSQQVLEHCRDNEGIPAEKLLVIPNGFPMDQTPFPDGDWQAFDVPAKARVILFVGRLHAQKGILEFTKAAEDLLARLPNHHFVLIGSGPQEDEVRRIITQSSHQSRMHLLGFREDALRWISAADILVLPAKYEGMPNVVLEAMACGTAVATFNVDGVSELLGESGTLHQHQVASAGDYEDLSNKIVALANSSTLRETCGIQNQQRIQNHFDLKKQLAKYRELYLNVIQQWQAANRT